MNPPSPQEVDRLDEQLGLVPELAGAGIGFVGGDECIALRAPQHSSGLKTYVVLQEGDASDITFNEGNWSRWLDSQDFYPWATSALDVLCLAGAAVSASAAIRSAQAIRRATGKSWTVILKGLSRAERKRLAEELIRTQKPGISGGGLKTLVRAGTFPKRLRSSEITERLFIQLKDAISASPSFAGSSTSGVVKLLYVHVVQE